MKKLVLAIPFSCLLIVTGCSVREPVIQSTNQPTFQCLDKSKSKIIHYSKDDVIILNDGTTVFKAMDKNLYRIQSSFNQVTCSLFSHVNNG